MEYKYEIIVRIEDSKKEIGSITVKRESMPSCVWYFGEDKDETFIDAFDEAGFYMKNTIDI